jgi:hypothetical protein
MPLHGALAGECRRDHHRLEMHVVAAADQGAAAAQTRLDALRYLSWVHAVS